MKKSLIVLILILFFSSCSSPNSKNGYIPAEHYDCYSEEDISELQNEISELESEIDRLNEQLEKYEERIEELLQESADFEEQAMEKE